MELCVCRVPGLKNTLVPLIICSLLVRNPVNCEIQREGKLMRAAGKKGDKLLYLGMGGRISWVELAEKLFLGIKPVLLLFLFYFIQFCKAMTC